MNAIVCVRCNKFASGAESQVTAPSKGSGWESIMLHSEWAYGGPPKTGDRYLCPECASALQAFLKGAAVPKACCWTQCRTVSTPEEWRRKVLRSNGGV